MDNERLAEIRQRINYRFEYGDISNFDHQAFTDLLAARDRLAAENADLRAKLAAHEITWPLRYPDPWGPTP